MNVLESLERHVSDPRVLRRIDSRLLGQAFEDWMSHCLQGQVLTASVDGKACRGVRESSRPSP
jgi:hypothetical protein